MFLDSGLDIVCKVGDICEFIVVWRVNIERLIVFWNEICVYLERVLVSMGELFICIYFVCFIGDVGDVVVR